jgi:predicted DNA-binding protein YlxM (UPF0122 family)
MGRQGCFLSEQEVRRVVHLLLSTDMTVAEIAERMRCSRSAVFSINRKAGVRDYNGRRSTWILARKPSVEQ